MSLHCDILNKRLADVVFAMRHLSCTITNLAEKLKKQDVTADSGLRVRLVSEAVLALEILEHTGSPVVSIEVNEGADSIHPLKLLSQISDLE